jgi:hypothetical protein
MVFVCGIADVWHDCQEDAFAVEEEAADGLQPPQSVLPPSSSAEGPSTATIGEAAGRLIGAAHALNWPHVGPMCALHILTASLVQDQGQQFHAPPHVPAPCCFYARVPSPEAGAHRMTMQSLPPFVPRLALYGNHLCAAILQMSSAAARPPRPRRRRGPVAQQSPP